MKTADQIRSITWVGVGVNIGLFFIKLCFGIVGHSHAVVADAVHSLSDLTTDFAVIFGVKYWTKPADEDHPYGHRRIEAIITIIISLILMGVGLGIGYDAISTIRDEHVVQPGWIALSAALISIVAKESLYRWTIFVARTVKSSALAANAWHHRSDAFSSIPVAIAVVVAMFNPQWSFIDRLGAFVVAIFILYAGWGIMRTAISEITDKGASPEYLAQIESIILATEGVGSYHALRTRQVGSGWYIDLHIQVDPDLTVKVGHDISEHVKKNLLAQSPDILDVVVHLEPA